MNQSSGSAPGLGACLAKFLHLFSKCEGVKFGCGCQLMRQLTLEAILSRWELPNDVGKQIVLAHPLQRILARAAPRVRALNLIAGIE